MLTCLKIVPVTYHLYSEFMKQLGEPILPGSEVNNSYILKDGTTKKWEWLNPHDFELNYKWLEGRATTDGWTAVARINEDLDLL